MNLDECNAATFATAHEHELCLKAANEYQVKLDEAEDRRLIKRDKLIIFLNACDSHTDLVIMETRHGRSMLPSDREKRKALREYGYKYTHGNVHKHARQQQFQCVDPAEVFEMLERNGY